ncbi:MAG: ATP-binding protein, partial [Alphaproteobacteria bacterium]
TETVDVVDMLRTLVEIETAGRLDGAGPRFRLELGSTVGGAAEVDGVEVRLGQVFRNLIANARSFSPPEGRVDLRIARREDRIVVSVEDEGPGIPPGKEGAIFDRFYSERPAGEAYGGHSGLGLSISRQIVEAHRGEIRAENRVAPDGAVLGARFVVVLPALAD